MLLLHTSTIESGTAIFSIRRKGINDDDDYQASDKFNSLSSINNFYEIQN